MRHDIRILGFVFLRCCATVKIRFACGMFFLLLFHHHPSHHSISNKIPYSILFCKATCSHISRMPCSYPVALEMSAFKALEDHQRQAYHCSWCDSIKFRWCMAFEFFSPFEKKFHFTPHCKQDRCFGDAVLDQLFDLLRGVLI